jgi:hypothetical protein
MVNALAGPVIKLSSGVLNLVFSPGSDRMSINKDLKCTSEGIFVTQAFTSAIRALWRIRCAFGTLSLNRRMFIEAPTAAAISEVTLSSWSKRLPSELYQHPARTLESCSAYYLCLAVVAKCIATHTPHEIIPLASVFSSDPFRVSIKKNERINATDTYMPMDAHCLPLQTAVYVRQ